MVRMPDGGVGSCRQAAARASLCLCICHCLQRANLTQNASAPDWLPLDQVAAVQRAEPQRLDATGKHDNEVPVRPHAGRLPRRCGEMRAFPGPVERPVLPSARTENAAFASSSCKSCRSGSCRPRYCAKTRAVPGFKLATSLEEIAPSWFKSEQPPARRTGA